MSGSNGKIHNLVSGGLQQRATNNELEQYKSPSV